MTIAGSAEVGEPARVVTIQVAKDPREQADALRQYGKKPGCPLDVLNDLAEILSRGDRRTDELVAGWKRSGLCEPGR